MLKYFLLKDQNIKIKSQTQNQYFKIYRQNKFAKNVTSYPIYLNVIKFDKISSK